MQLITLDDSHIVTIAQRLELLAVGEKALHVRRLVGQIAVAHGQIAVDVETCHPLGDDFDRLDAHQLEVAYAVCANLLFEPVNIVTNAANQLTTITATGAPADLMPLQQHHRQPAFGQFQRGVDAGKATANDADVGLLLPLQDRQPELLVGGRGVIRRSVLVGMG